MTTLSNYDLVELRVLQERVLCLKNCAKYNYRIITEVIVLIGLGVGVGVPFILDGSVFIIILGVISGIVSSIVLSNNIISLLANSKKFSYFGMRKVLSNGVSSEFQNFLNELFKDYPEIENHVKNKELNVGNIKVANAIYTDIYNIAKNEINYQTKIQNRKKIKENNQNDRAY